MTATNSNPLIDIRKLIAIILISIVVSIIFDSLLTGTWNSVTTAISIHAMLSFLAIICAGFILVQYRVREHGEDTVFHAALFYASIVNIGRVVRVTFDNSIINGYGEASTIVNELVFLAVFSLLVILGVVMKKNEWIKSRTFSSMILIVGGISLHIGILYLIIPNIPESVIIPFGTIIGVIPSFLLPISGVMWVRIKSQSGMFDLTYLTAGFVIFGIAWLPFVVSLYLPITVWTLSFAFMTFGLVLLSLSSGLPFLKRIGMKSEYAYFIILGLTSLGVLPVTITVVVNSLVTLPIIHNIELFIVVHLGASLMAAVMAFLMYQYDKQKPAPKRRPIVSLFITWATIEAYQVVKAVLIPGDSLVLSIIPYLIGSIFLLVHIPYAIKWTGQSPDIQQANPNRVVIVAPIIFCIILVSEILQQFIHSSPIGMGLEPLGNSLLLGVSLLGMFAFVYHSSVQVKDGRGKVTVDVLTTGFLALWIIPSMIKAIFEQWTTGWWTAEIILLLAVLFGPAILGFLYLRELGRAAETQKRATLFADLLLHDISNYHQALAFSIGLLEMDDAGFKAKEQAIRDANIELQRADQLIRNVRRLSMADQLIPERLSSVDLVPVLSEAYELAARKTKKPDIKFHVEAPEGECDVRANALLKDVFLNLFDNSIQYCDETPEINVIVENVSYSREEWCSITISDNARGIDPKRRARLFERYMEDAVGTGLGMSVVRTLIQAYGGTINIEERVPSDYKKGTVFRILLKKV